MTGSSIITLYKCGDCGEVHDHEDEAQACCMPAVHEVYQCPACEEVYDTHAEATKCCNAGDLVRCPCCTRDYGVRQIAYHAVKIAGHCAACQPLFTVDEQFAIEDAHHELTGKLGSILIGEATS